MTEQHVDIAIVGAGIAGSALAAALSASSLDVALIDAEPLAQDWPETELEGVSVADYGSRVSALSAASSNWLATLGVWPEIVARRVCGYRHMRVWDGVGTGTIDFDAASINQPVLGHIVENRLTQAALHLRLAAGVRRYSPAMVASLQHGERGVRIVLADGRAITATLLVGADGGRSKVRTWSGLATRSWDYGHRALVATVACEKPHRETAWQRFTPDGPLAFLPLGGGEGRFCSIVWSTVPEQAEQLLELSDSAFCRRLGMAFEHRLGAIEAVSARHAFPLWQMHAVDYVQPGLALIGDAAHTIHPLAGQGINMGLLDARVLAEELQRAVRRGLSVGDPQVLGRYQRRRKGHNLLMMAAMEGFKRLFASRQPAVLLARNAGLQWLQPREALKRPLIRAAMGWV